MGQGHSENRILTVQLPRPPWRPLRPGASHLEAVGRTDCVANFFLGELAGADLAFAAKLYKPEDIRDVLNRIRPDDIHVDQAHMAVLLEEGKRLVAAVNIDTFQHVPDGEDKMKLHKLPKEASMDFFNKTLLSHAVVGLRELAEMHNDRRSISYFRKSLLDGLKLTDEERKSFAACQLRNWN